MSAGDAYEPQEHPELDPDRPSIARIYDYWLGGHHNFAPDREVGQRILDMMPSLRDTMWANRAFLRRIVKRLVIELGITQFIDLGSGVPTVGNVHEIAQQENPESRVVYVDIDSVAVAQARQLLADNPRAATIRADLRDSEAVLGNPELHAVIDLAKPVALLMISVLHFIPDSDDPGRIVRAYMDALAPGSYLGLAHGTLDIDAAPGQPSAASSYQEAVGVPLILRPAETVAAWLRDMEIVEPGILPVNQWLPDGEIGADVQTFGLLARKP